MKVFTEAARDPNSLVRNNAVRGLSALAQSGIGRALHLNPAPLLELFKSVSWTDWNKASFALMALTANADSKLLQQIARTIEEPLRQMTNWPPMHAEPSRVILERITHAGK
jgi:hypothetical protein